MDSMINELSDANMSFKHYLTFLCSPVVAVADPSENVVDEAWMTVVFFFVAAPAVLVVILTTG